MFPFYDMGQWSARQAYSWRDYFLLTIRDEIVPFQTIVNEATGQLDGMAFYPFNENWRIGLLGVTLLQEQIKTPVIIADDLQTAPPSWNINDRRFSVILLGYF